MGADLVVIAGDDAGLANFGNEVVDGALRAGGARAGGARAGGARTGSCFSTSDVREVGVGISRSLKLPVRDVPVDSWLEESFRGAILSVLLGGGAMGSGLFIGLTRGGGTRSRSRGRVGSIGGLLLSGGGLSG